MIKKMKKDKKKMNNEKKNEQFMKTKWKPNEKYTTNMNDDLSHREVVHLELLFVAHVYDTSVPVEVVRAPEASGVLGDQVLVCAERKRR